MGAAVRIFCSAVLASAIGVGAGGCISSNRLDTTLNTCDGRTGETPITFPCFKFTTPVPPPTGFSSTYQKYLIDRQRQARLQTEQYAQAVAATKAAPVNERAVQSQAVQSLPAQNP